MVTAAPILLLALLGQGGAVSASAATAPDPAQEVLRLQEAIRKQPEMESNYTELGNLLLRTQNFPQAAAVLQAARSRFSSSPQVALSLGVAHYGQRKFADAVGAFVEAGRLAPEIEQPVVFLSRLQEHWGDRKDAVVALFEAYAKRNPASALAQFALGKATGDAATLRRAVELSPKMAEAHFELGNALESQRNFAAAIESYRKAAQLAPQKPDPHYRLARLYARTGDRAKADQERALHEKLSAQEKAEVDRRQAATRHLSFGEKK